MQMATSKGYYAEYLWHLDQFETKKYSHLIIPGGFSYGDYLRSGALAARSPIMKSVREFVQHGGPVLGICNGFQILTEAGLLPGALLKNAGGRFIDAWVDLKLVGRDSEWSKNFPERSVRLPVAHGDGRFHASPDEVKKLFDNGRVWFTYIDNPNGSVDNIAGVMNETGKIVGLMPHPERAIFDWMGSLDGGFFL